MSCVRSARISSVRGWNGAKAATSSRLGWPSRPSFSGSSTGKSYCFESARRTSVAVMRPSRTAASPKRTPFALETPSTRSTSAEVILPSSTRIAPMGRSARTTARWESRGSPTCWGCSNDTTRCVLFMTRNSSGGIRKRLRIARAAEEPRRLPGLQRADERRVETGLEVGGGAHAPVEKLEEEDRGEPEQHADEESEREVERDAGLRRHHWLRGGIEDRDVRLLRARLDLVHEIALQCGFVRLLRGIDVANEHLRAAARLAQRFHFLALLGEVAVERRAPRRPLAGGRLRAAHDLARLAPDAFAQRLHLGRLLLVLRMVRPEPRRQLLELRLAAQELALQSLHERIRDDIGRVLGRPAARDPEARARVVAQVGLAQRLRR